MSVMLASIGRQASQSFASFIPRLGGAIILLVAGLLIVRVLARVIARALVRAGVDGFGERTGVHDVLARVGLRRSLARMIGLAFRILAGLLVVFSAVSLLGLQFLSVALNRVVLFIPNALAAIALVVVGLLAGTFARRQVDRTAYQMDLPDALGQLTQWAIVAIFSILAAGEIGIPVEILVVVAAILATGAVLTGALAFGLGGRDMARELSAGRYVRQAHEVGEHISVDGLEGEITQITPAATVLRDRDGKTVRVPNHTFTEHPVRTLEPPAPNGSAGEE